MVRGKKITLPAVEIFQTDNWIAETTSRIALSVNQCKKSMQKCSLMLTGGNTAETLYRYWKDCQPWSHQNIKYYFGDERCVEPTHFDSNYGMAMRVYFSGLAPSSFQVFRMAAELENRSQAAQDYEKLLPDSIDVLLLGLGLDGHIASIFPRSAASKERTRMVVPATGPAPLVDRITITPPVIEKAKSVFVLALGEQKGCVLAKALENMDDCSPLPIGMFGNAVWLLDQEAGAPVNNAIERLQH